MDDYGLKIESAGELDKDDAFMIVLYGDTGTGKSTIGAKAGRKNPPLILLTEPNGLASIRGANKNAQVMRIDTFDQFRQALAMLRDVTGKAVRGEAELPWEFVVIDSFTDAQRLLKQEMISKTFKLWKQSNPDAVDMDKITLNQNQWGTIIDKSLTLIREFRNLPLIHKVLICLQETVTVANVGEDSETLFRQPQCLGRKTVPGNMASMANIVGMTFRGGRSGKYGVIFRNDSGEAMTKDINTLDAIETPDINKWVDILRIGADSSKFVGWDDDSADEPTDEPKPKTKK